MNHTGETKVGIRDCSFQEMRKGESREGMVFQAFLKRSQVCNCHVKDNV